LKFDEPQPNSQAVRWVNAGLAAVYFFVCGMLIYFRLGPFQRVAKRFQEQGADFPAWFDLVFSVGVGLVTLLLLWRGVVTLRRALRD
jgi:hypothetical protein